MNNENINYDKYAKEIYDWNVDVGWWDDPKRCLYQTMQLVSTEIAEATEGERKNLMDDHLPHRKQGEVELADTLIRVLDLGGKFQIRYRNRSPHVWALGEATIGKQHFAINAALMQLAIEADTFGWGNHLAPEYSTLISTIEYVSYFNEYDLEAAMIEKLAYNKTRIDHTRAHRADSVTGKKF